MICPSCSYENSDDAAFCTNCGQRLAGKTGNMNTQDPIGQQGQQGGYYGEPNNYSQWGGRPEEKPPVNGLAIASMVIGIASVFACIIPYLCIPLTIVGLILGIIGYRKPGNRGMALAGIILNIIFLVLTVIILIFAVYLVTTGQYYKLYHHYLY